MKCEKYYLELEMKDLVHRFRVWCSPTSPRAKGRRYWFDGIAEASFFLKVCPLRLQDAARYGYDRVYWKGRTYLLFWNKVCWSGRHGVKDY